MNRIQFWTLIVLSALVVLLLFLQVVLVRQDNAEKNRLAQAQQAIQQGQGFQANLKQLAVRIYQDEQKTQDQGLKDLLTRQQISYSQPSTNAETNATEPSPAAH